MVKDSKHFRRNSTPIGNNENKSSHPLEPPPNHLDSDPTRPPLNQIQEPLQNPIPISRRKPEFTTTPSKTAPFRTPEKQFSTSSRNRFGWVPNSTTGTDISEETNHHHVPPQLPPLNRYGTITPRNYKYSIGKASSVHSDSSSTHSTPSKSVTKPAYLLSGSRPPVSAGNRVGFTKGLPVYPGPITIVDSPTVPHFELREDPSFWLDHNVQVVIRVRPLNGNERTMFGYNRCLKQDTCQNITWIGQPETRFVFDYVACETINQEMLFRVAGLPMVENCISGYNSCMFAYGQTGSGKTHTMLGEISDLNVKPSQDRGMTPRIFEFLFARIRAEEESRRDEKLRYNCKCSFLEIYNEQITDLLDPSSTNLLIREDVQKGVYVENLTEFKVGSVDDILTLIIQGSANRRVAATNMNRESSRSHSVFTCVIESTWEKDSTTNFRFARLNLVDLAGSERQKTSGAEGERLKEAASINKSLSTLGHVIMVLSDLANGKQRHVPYRDSRLTFLLQDSLGGNSKTMIIANISPSMCSANETLSTLKFAQRARLIQNNAIVNEDMSGDVQALQHQIRLLKEELASIKRQNSERHTPNTILEMEEEFDEMASISSSINSIRISNKQWKSLEVTLVGALRRERTAETTIKQLEAEIEQLNRLVRQREEDTRCTKMMLKFREEKINRMEALVKGEITSESYLSEDNTAKSKEIDLLRSKLERNPEVTRFALENIRLLDQLRRYQDFYEEGERDLMMNEISQMRNQLIQLLDGKPEMDQQLCSEIQNQENKNAQIGNSNGDKESFPYELRKTSEELERCRNDLQACLEMNAKLTRDISDLQTEISTTKSTQYEQCSIEEKFSKLDHEETIKHAEEILNYQLELDILKSILEEHKSANSQAQQNFLDLQTNLKSTKTELNIAKSVIEALESQNIELINELDEERFNSSKIFKKTEPKRNSLRSLENEDSPLNAKLRKMQASLDKVRNLKHGADSSVEREMDEVRKQVEIETAEVIVCLQEEINSFEEQIEASNARIKVLESEKVDLEREREERERDWEGFADELEIALSNGNLALEEAFEQVATISGTFSQKERVELQVGNLIRGICERDDVIEELNKCFEDAQNVRSDLEWKLRSLRGATLAITDAHQQEKSEKGREICSLKEEREKIYDELVRSCVEKEVLIKCVGSVQSESVLKFQEMEMEFQMREMEFESRIQEERREKEREVGLLGEEMSRLSDELVRFSVEKEVVEESLVSRIQEERREKKREVGLLGEEISRLSDELVRFSVEKEVVVKSLVSVQSESELKIQEMESRFVCDQRQSQNSFQCLASQVLKLDGEICSLKEERESLYDESVRSFVEKDVLLKYFGLVQSELDLKFQEIESDFQLREVEKSEKLREVCSLREERDDESVQSFIEKDVLMKCFSLVQIESNLKFRKIESEFQMREMDFESRIREEKSEKERDICSLREERDDESVRSFIEKDVLLKYFVLVQSELDLKFQEIELEFETRIREEKREKERELCSLREERDDESVRSFIEKDVLMKCFSLVQTGSSLKFQNIESEVQMRELEFESRIQEVQREKQREISSLREEMSGLSDELVRFFIEKEILVESLISTQSESELKIQELESRTENDQKQNQSSFECLASQVLRMERDIGDKEKNYEIKMQDMQNKLLGLENSVIVTNESWYKQKEALENELNDAKSLSAEKTFEVSNLMSKIEETQETIKDADNTVNALIRVNETLKREIERCRQTETLISNEKTALQIQIETLNSSLCAKEREYEIICDLVADLENFVRELQSSVLDNFESISCDVDQVKSEFKGCVNLARNLLGETWLEIIRKDCAISVLNLCQMGRIVERVTGLTLQNGFLQNGICESNSLISNLRENNLKAKSEIELYSVIKGKLLADITHSFNRISNKEEETNEMKMKFELFEKKILELQLQEEMMLERSNCMYNELANLANEIDNVKKYELSNERERISRVFDEMEMVMVLSMIDLNLSFEENEMMENELSEMKGNYDKLLEENSGLRDLIYSSNLHIETLKEEIMQKNSQLEEAKSEDIASKTVLIDSVLTRSERIFNSMDANIELMSHKAEKDVIEQIDMVSKFECEVELLETLFEKLKLKAENCSLQSELNRRDEIANGLLFDLKLLQESSSRAKDEKEIEIENLNNELETLNTQLDKLNGEIETLFSSIEERDCTIETLQCENSELKPQIENLNCARDEIEAELDEKTGVIEKLEEELIKIQNLVYEKEGLIQELQNEINRIKGDFDLANSHCEENKGLIEELVNEITKLERNFDMANALAKENEAIASEARQIAEEKKVYAQEKEEEVKLLENSIEELESTIYALESKVDLVKEDAEKQRIKRELIEAELQQLRKQLGNNCSIDAKNQILDLKRNLELLEKELSEKEAEISQCKGHISELNMHAEAQAREYKQRFKELEAMGQQVQQVKSIESNGSNGSNGSVGQPNSAKTNRATSSPFKGNRGSGSPFKCMGLGMIQQMYSEKDEDLVALKRQIEELESLASSRQKEIFMLNTRLAAAESMTHDVIRDLLGVKMDMSSYASLLDNRHKLTLDETNLSDDHQRTQEQEEEIKKLKKRLNEFIEERQGWIEEINQRQNEMMKARVSAEKLKQREQLLLTEYEMLKCENENYKNRIVQLEDEIQRVPSQHSLHLRIHHHAKTKDENNLLRKKNEDLSAKLQKTEGILARVRDELARYRVSNGKDPYFENEDEDQLRIQLQESEEDRLQLAEKLLNLCTSVLKVAGVTANAEMDANPTAAESAVDRIRDRITSLEDEVHDLKLKCKLQWEKEKLAELRWESSPLRVRLKDSTCGSPIVSLS